MEEAFKGNPGSEVVLKEPGGSVGGRTAIRLGTPSFKKGERVLLFLRDIGDGYYRVFGLSQGKFSIVRDKEAGRDVLQRNLSGLDIVDPRYPQEIGMGPDQQKVFLDDYIALIKKLIK